MTSFPSPACGAGWEWALPHSYVRPARLLAAQGYRSIRFSNLDATKNKSKMLATIAVG
jgi:hypothetical protein